MHPPDIASFSAPRRRIELAGPVNFRDLGGYATVDGERVRWRRVFRSDSLGPVTPADASHLTEELGLVSVVDLRSTDEVEKEGRGALVDAAVEYHHLPLFEVVPGLRPEWPDTLHELYRRLLTDSADRVAAVLRVIASADAHPVVFHCVAGKDRTGIVAALVLGLLGVSDEDIVTDYALTQEVMAAMIERYPRRAFKSSVGSPYPSAILRAEAETMRHTLGELADAYGSAVGWAASAAVDPAAIAALRSALLS